MGLLCIHTQHTHTHTHTLQLLYIPGHAGGADVVSVGCVYTGASSSQEIKQLTATSDPSSLQSTDPLIGDDYELYTNRLEDCSALFDTVNPHTPSYKTVVIRNFRSAVKINYMNHSRVSNCFSTCSCTVSTSNDSCT